MFLKKLLVEKYSILWNLWHFKVINDKLSKTDKDDFGELNRLMDERDYWLSLNKGKEKYKWFLRLKNNK